MRFTDLEEELFAYVCNVEPDEDILSLPVMNFAGFGDGIREREGQKQDVNYEVLPSGERRRKGSDEGCVGSEDDILPLPNWHVTPLLVDWQGNC
jgi:hypothetical protein